MTNIRQCMISNFYTYFFITAVFLGAALAILLRTFKEHDRKIIWSVTSVSFLVFIIMAVLGIFTALFFVDDKPVVLREVVIFCSIVAVFCSVLFYYIKIFALPLILLVLGGIAFYYHLSLADLQPFEHDNNFHIYVLKEEEESLSLEICDFHNKTQFIDVEGIVFYPLFTIVHFPEYLFFLQNTSYLKYDEILVDLESFYELMEENYLLLKASRLPFISHEKYDPIFLGKGVFNSFYVELYKNGTFNFKAKNY